MAPSEAQTDVESLSSLSDVDEHLLETKKNSLVSLEHSKFSAGRPRSSKPAGVNARDKTHGRTALHKACSKGNLDRIQDLVEDKGALINLTDNAGVTPLHDACSQGHIDVVRYLLDKGASTSARDCEGDYPLLDAAQNDYLDICQLLLDHGANPTTQNSKGMSALSEAEEGPVKDLLRQYSSKFDSPGQNRMKITDVISLDESCGNPKIATSPQRISDRVRPRSSQLNIDSNGARKVDINGRDQLHQYVIDGDDDLVEQFLEIQDCDYQDNNGDTPLHSAARLGNAHLCGLLLQYNAKVSIKNKRGNTALHEACVAQGNREVIVALLDAGASTLVRNADGQIPIEIAENTLGPEAPEARLLLKTTSKERAKSEARLRKRTVKRELTNSPSQSTMTSPAISPRPTRAQHVLEPRESTDAVASKRKVARRKAPTLVDELPQEIAITVATSAPPEIMSTTKQISRAGVPTTQFLTQFKTNCGLSHIDSSIRGSPLPSQPAVDISKRQVSPGKSVAPLQSEVNAANPPQNTNTVHKRKATVNGSAKVADAAPSPKRVRNDADGPISETRSMETTNDTATQERDSMIEAIILMGRNMVETLEKQHSIMTTMLKSIDELAETQRRK